MNKNLSKWLPWVVVAAVVVVALFFVDYDRVFKSTRTVGEEIEIFAADSEVSEIDDDVEFEKALDDTGADDEFVR